jgi:hypothetical protein
LDVKQIFKILAAAPVTFARAPRAAQVGMVLFFAAAGCRGRAAPPYRSLPRSVLPSRRAGMRTNETCG